MDTRSSVKHKTCPTADADKVLDAFDMDFQAKRRQRFLKEVSYQTACLELGQGIRLLEFAGSGRSPVT